MRPARSPRPGRPAARTSASARSGRSTYVRSCAEPSSVWNGGPPCAIGLSCSDDRLVQIAVAGTSNRRGSLTCTGAAHDVRRVRHRAPAELREAVVVDALDARALRGELLPRGQRDLDLLGGGGVDGGAVLERAGVDVDRAPHAVGPLVDDLADERAPAAVADEDDVAVEAVDEVGEGADVVGARDAAARLRRARGRAGSARGRRTRRGARRRRRPTPSRRARNRGRGSVE